MSPERATEKSAQIFCRPVGARVWGFGVGRMEVILFLPRLTPRAIDYRPFGTFSPDINFGALLNRLLRVVHFLPVSGTFLNRH